MLQSKVFELKRDVSCCERRRVRYGLLPKTTVAVAFQPRLHHKRLPDNETETFLMVVQWPVRARVWTARIGDSWTRHTDLDTWSIKPQWYIFDFLCVMCLLCWKLVPRRHTGVKMSTTSSWSTSTPHSNFSPHGLHLVQLTNCKAVTGKDFFISVERYIGQSGSPYIGQSGSPTRPGIGNLIPTCSYWSTPQPAA